SGEQKWGRLSGLVMFLPHGFEGQGPEHSSARLERYLQLCAQHNMQVCVPTTPAQTFHMLRRQLLRQYRKPLIVMTPKSLLRHPLAISQVGEITQGQFQVLIDEIDEHDPNQISRLILCTGKVYYDLLEKRRELALGHIAIIRIEQLYPFPEEALCQTIKTYPNVEHYLWCQEEPLNQGAWYNQQHHIRLAIGDRAKLEHATRPASASPAAGSLKTHRAEQQQLIAQALGLTAEPSRNDHDDHR
ncbi:MAG TPA: 2-oxoglutarate dehydrogenase E1 component, partial [Gammaproteobacteria bacterium]|nr:2-oxoglutarate dehydrogenase E1 component [Gammaproteobacteria bacterium]